MMPPTSGESHVQRDPAGSEEVSWLYQRGAEERAQEPRGREHKGAIAREMEQKCDTSRGKRMKLVTKIHKRRLLRYKHCELLQQPTEARKTGKKA